MSTVLELLIQERDKLNQAIEALSEHGVSTVQPKRKYTKRKGRKKFTAKQRAELSKKMKAAWKRRKAEGK